MPRSIEEGWLGRTPLTDPWAILTSGAVHAGLLLLGSLVVLSASVPGSARGPKALHAELDSAVDRPPVVPPQPGEGGGGPGQMGGTSRLPRTQLDHESPQGATRDPLADTLLTEILPQESPIPSAPAELSLPGPSAIGQGLIPGSGVGGGGGAGGGSAKGSGPGIGPGTQFFGAREHAHSFAYVIDCSGSMETRSALTVAKRELMASLGQLPPDAAFAVIFYNLEPWIMDDPRGRKGLMAATRSNKGWVESQLSRIKADGGTDHKRALTRALEIKPEVIFFLTDADMMSNSDVNLVLDKVGSTRIQAIEFGYGVNLGEQTPLARLATTTGGAYLYIDVSKFPRTPLGY